MPAVKIQYQIEDVKGNMSTIVELTQCRLLHYNVPFE